MVQIYKFKKINLKIKYKTILDIMIDIKIDIIR